MSQTEPKFMGKRISVLRSKDDIVVTITQQIERWQMSLLISWLLAWTFCGGVFITYMIKASVFEERIFFVICTGLWAFFMIRLTKVFLWRKGGREIIRISAGTLSLYNAYWSKGKPEDFKLNSVFKLGLIKRDPSNFFAFLDDSFWIIGGERVGFSYGGEKVRLGKQLDLREAENLVRILDSAIREFSKREKA
ncbi:MAG: hypothetical protein RLZZ77_1228 [Bacteroidota bacterium]|jgi:hypothetical protein